MALKRLPQQSFRKRRFWALYPVSDPSASLTFILTIGDKHRLGQVGTWKPISALPEALSLRRLRSATSNHKGRGSFAGRRLVDPCEWPGPAVRPSGGSEHLPSTELAE